MGLCRNFTSIINTTKLVLQQLLKQKLFSTHSWQRLLNNAWHTRPPCWQRKISSLWKHLENNTKTFQTCGSISRTVFLALLVNWWNNPAYCTVVELSMVVLIGIPAAEKINEEHLHLNLELPYRKTRSFLEHFLCC